jgi:hypothetical protein
MKIHPMGDEFFHVGIQLDERTDWLTHMKLMTRSLEFCERKKKNRKVSKMYVKCLEERSLDGFENSYFGYVDRIKFSQLLTKL